MNWYAYCENNPINNVDPDGKDDVGFSSLEGVVVAVLDPRTTNAAGAAKGTAFAFPPRTAEAQATDLVNAGVATPIVSGGQGNPTTPVGTWAHIQVDPTSISGNRDIAGGFFGKTYARLPGTGGDAFHAARETATAQGAFTLGCFAAVPQAGGSANTNYKAVLQAAGVSSPVLSGAPPMPAGAKFSDVNTTRFTVVVRHESDAR